MHPAIMTRIGEWVQDISPEGTVVEFGAAWWKKSLLSLPELEGQKLVAVNLSRCPCDELKSRARFIRCSSNNLRGRIRRRSVSLVLCNAMLEHDLKPWETAAEVARILKPGGLAIIGIPSFQANAELVEAGILKERFAERLEKMHATLTFRFHAPPDYWRFSPMGIESLFSSLELQKSEPILPPPRTLFMFRKPSSRWF